MRAISFALTTSQFLDGSKTVTRRMGWLRLKIGDVLCAVEKSQGLKRGEKVKRLGTIRVVDIRREPLMRMLDDIDYGISETAKEGFASPHPCWRPSVFAEFFCDTHKDCRFTTELTRIEFERVAPPQRAGEE